MKLSGKKLKVEFAPAFSMKLATFTPEEQAEIIAAIGKLANGEEVEVEPVEEGDDVPEA